VVTNKADYYFSDKFHSLFFSSVTVAPNMRIKDRAFTGSTSYLATAKHLQTIAGKNISFFPNLPQNVSLSEKTFTYS
jgi:hypothetical protein